ncbi:YceI family protein [Methylibium sp.]|uniref:YceI family protein n=1 Tax=Methylibium sp. TaxID=2067992 RepID=UPI003D13E098
MKKHFAAAVLAIALPVASVAAPKGYIVDPQHSVPRFTYNHFGFSTQMARFNKVSGKFSIDWEAKTGTVEFSIDASSIDSGIEPLNKHLRGPDFFDVEKYPTATFKSTLVTFEGDRPVSIQGDLTMHGATQSVNFIVTSFKHGPHGFLQNRESIGGTATAIMSRTAFGLGRYAPNVGDDVTVTISLEAVKE